MPPEHSITGRPKQRPTSSQVSRMGGRRVNEEGPQVRPAEEYIADLHAAAKAKQASQAAVVVGYRARQAFELIWGNWPDALGKLKDALSRRGRAIGVFMLIRRSELSAEMKALPFDEYDGEEWVEKLLMMP
jgi:hypothetical protein